MLHEASDFRAEADELHAFLENTYAGRGLEPAHFIQALDALGRGRPSAPLR